MRVAFLAAANSIHTIQWVKRLASRGLDVHLVTLHEPTEELGGDVVVHYLPYRPPIGYVTATRAVQRVLSRLNPDVTNVHYATGYGTLARLAGAKPLLLSVWGSDVYDFPLKSPLHRQWLVANLRAATAVASTSHAMAKVVHRYWTPPKTYITPFGVDEKQFLPRGRGSQGGSREFITIGTVKTLARKYGVDTLIRAFARLYSELKSTAPAVAAKLRLVIVGGGPEEGNLRKLARELGIDRRTEFRGRIPHALVPHTLREFDVYVALSRLDSESFGVAIIEASACAVPVVVSDADGPREVVVDKETGFVVERDKPEAAAKALKQLVLSEDLRWRMGQAGRKHVLENYTWDRCLDIMISVYSELAQAPQ